MQRRVDYQSSREDYKIVKKIIYKWKRRYWLEKVMNPMQLCLYTTHLKRQTGFLLSCILSILEYYIKRVSVVRWEQKEEIASTSKK